QGLTCVAWISVPLGLAALYASIKLRVEKARRRLMHFDSTTTTHTTTTSLPSPPILPFSPYERFLLAYLFSCVFGSTALTLTSFFHPTATIVYLLMAARNALLVTCLSLYLAMLLDANPNEDPQLRRLRRSYAWVVAVPTAVMVALFVYQARLMDAIKGHPDLEAEGAPDRVKFERVQLANNLVLLVIFLAFDAMVVFAAMLFKRHLADLAGVVHAGRRRRRTSELEMTVVGVSSAGPKPDDSEFVSVAAPPSSRRSGTSSSTPAPQPSELELSLRSSLATIRTIALALHLFLAYCLFFTLVIVLLGSPHPVYFVTFAVNWWWPTGFGLILFPMVLAHRRRQWLDSVVGSRRRGSRLPDDDEAKDERNWRPAVVPPKVGLASAASVVSFPSSPETGTTQEFAPAPVWEPKIATRGVVGERPALRVVPQVTPVTSAPASPRTPGSARAGV
ncbi:hypothetical protein HDU96_001629, partial [Phlyctochytrium bullatum]